jgi:predicted MFS family arabinose efflux permease
MRRSTIWMMAIASGVVVANNYYNQPLLPDFAAAFHVTEGKAGIVAILAQTGYAIGMLLLLPLGDMMPRRRLINIMLVLSAISLVAMGSAQSMTWLAISSFTTGFASIVPQMMTPFAAKLAEPSERGSAVGLVMGGLLCGILLSRTVSGAVGAHFGWRTMYWLAAGIMIVLLFALLAILPHDKPTFHGKYSELMRSMRTLICEEPVLRETSAVAALQFAAFSAFWTTLAFHLHDMPAHYGSDVAGLFGLAGVVGVIAAPRIGKLADKRSPQFAVLLSSIVFIIAYLIFTFAQDLLWVLAIGVILLDLGMQSGHVSNMTRNFGLQANAMNRVNTVYMVTRFFGGALGSTLGSYAWAHWKWTGVCMMGLALSAAAIMVQIVHAKMGAAQTT